MVKQRLSISIAVLTAMLFAACGHGSAYRISDGYMLGTTFHIVARTDIGSDALFNMAARIDREAKASMSLFDSTSLLSRINANLTDSLDRHLSRNIGFARRIWEISSGAYDITVAPLTEAYGFGRGEALDRFNVDSVLEFVGLQKLEIEEGRLRKSDPRIQIDLNSIAKGYTVDLLAEELEKIGCTDYIVEVGGEIRARGVSPRGGEWRVAVDSPFEGNDSPGEFEQTVIGLESGAIATSGNYRRFRIGSGNEHIVHTIDPLSGKSTRSRLLSATVKARSCMEADALATMFMVLGDRRAVEMAESMRDTVSVYFVMAPEKGEKFDVFSTLE